MDMIGDKLAKIMARLAAAARQAGRQPDEIKLVAVSKRVSWELIKQAADCGQLLFGENYIQEAQEKIPCLEKTLTWHFIGYLQSNKAKLAAQLFQVVETVDRIKLAQALDKHLAAMNKTMSILIQVNIGREPQKAGVLPERTGELIRQISPLKHLAIKGLMAMPPFEADPEKARPYFRQTRLLAEELRDQGLLPRQEPLELSMGMSGDFEVAIEEGATLVRVGTAIFGTRG